MTVCGFFVVEVVVVDVLVLVDVDVDETGGRDAGGAVPRVVVVEIDGRILIGGGGALFACPLLGLMGPGIFTSASAKRTR